MNKIKIIFANLFKVLFCFYLTCDIFYYNFIFYGLERAFQLYFSIAVSIIVAIVNWSVLFSKAQAKTKLIVIISTIIITHLIKYYA